MANAWGLSLSPYPRGSMYAPLGIRALWGLRGIGEDGPNLDKTFFWKSVLFRGFCGAHAVYVLDSSMQRAVLKAFIGFAGF